MKLNGFKVDDFEKAQKRAVESGMKLIDDTLYELCRKYPNHSSKQEIAVKVYVIGRTYMTGIERQLDEEKVDGQLMDGLVNLIYKEREAVSALIADLPSKVRFDLSILDKVFKAHTALIQIIGPILDKIRYGKNKNKKLLTPHSFSSKYLHFHSPIVPVYDSIAETTLGFSTKTNACQDQKFSEVDPIYLNFLFRFLNFYLDAEKKLTDSSLVTVKNLDYYLLYFNDLMEK